MHIGGYPAASDRCDPSFPTNSIHRMQNRRISSYASQSAVHFKLNVKGLTSQGDFNDYK